MNVLVCVLAKTVEAMWWPELGRSGVLKYSYVGAANCSTYRPSASESRSYTVSEAVVLAPGSTSRSSMAKQVYAALLAAAEVPVHSTSLCIVLP